jgi:hypothetical protein
MGSIGNASGESNFNLDMDEVEEKAGKVNHDYLGTAQPLLSDRINELNRSASRIRSSLLGADLKESGLKKPISPNVKNNKGKEKDLDSVHKNSFKEDQKQ